MQLENQSLNIEEENVALCILGIRSQSLNQQGTAAILHEEIAALILIGVQLLQLMDSSLRGMSDGGHVAMPQATEEMHRRIREAHLGGGAAARLDHILIARRHHFLGQHSVQHSIQVARLHLPHVHRAVGTADHQEVVQWSPLYADHREQMATGQRDTLLLGQTEQRHRVIRGDGTNAFLNAGLQEIISIYIFFRIKSCHSLINLHCNCLVAPAAA